MSNSQLLGSKIGVNQSQVARDQRALNLLIGANLDDDGIAGDLTKEAVKRFQKRYKLKEDGIIGDDTRRELNRQLQQYFQHSSIDKDTNSKITIFIDSLLDALDSTFNNKLFKILSCLEAGSLENSHNLNVTSLKSLYKRALHQRDYYEKLIKKIPENLKKIQRQASKEKDLLLRQQLNNEYNIKHKQHITNSGRQVTSAKNTLNILDKTKNIGTTFKDTLPKIQTLFKPFGKVFKALSWTEVCVDLTKGIKYFFDGNINEGFHYLNKTFSKILEIAISIYLTELAIAGTITLCATAGVGAVGTIIAVLVVVLIIALLLMVISTIWDKFTDSYYANL